MLEKNTCYLSTLLVVTMLFAPSVFSEPAAEPFVESVTEEVVTIATRRPIESQLLPNNIAVLQNEAIQRVSATHGQELLNRLPGVNFQRGNGQESLPSIRSPVLTGAGACGNLLIMEEGIPVRGFGFCNVNELFDTHFEQAGRVEVMRGANTVFYGSNALAGSVNVVLPASAPNSVGLDLGSDNFSRALLSIGYGDETRGHVYFTSANDGGYRDDSAYTQQKFSWRQEGTWRGWQVQPGVTLTHLDQNTAGFLTGLDSYRDKQQLRRNEDPEAYRESDSFRGWLRLQHHLSASEQIQITPYLRYTDMRFLQHFLPGDPLEENHQQGFGWQSSYQKQFSDDFSLTVGLDAEFGQGELTQSQANATQGSAFLQATVPAGLHYDYGVNSQQWALFSQADWQWHPQWRLSAGVRFESNRYDYDNHMLNGRTRDDGSECGFGGCRYSRPEDSKDSFNHASPKLSLHYQAWEDISFYFSASDAFRAPQATELYRLQREQQVADLDIVKAQSLDFGMRIRGDILNVDLSVYDLKYDNLIIRDSDFFNVDGAKSDSQGIEIDAKLNLSSRFSLRWVANWAQHEYSSDQVLSGVNINGNKVDTAPKFFGSAYLHWQFENGFDSELEWQRMGAYYLDPENQHRYPGHNVWHWRSSVQAGEDLKFSLRVLNVFDQRYAQRADYTGFTGERYFPGEPRAVHVGVRYQFR